MSFFANLLGNYITGRILGGKKGGNIAALGTAVPFLLQQGLGSDGFSLDSLFGGGKQSDPVSKAVTNMAKVPMSGPKASEVAQISKVADAVTSKAGISPVFTQGEGTLGYSKFLIDAGLLNPDSKVANLLNTRVGEALATSLASGIGSKLSGGGGSSGSVSRPFGGEGNVSLNIGKGYKLAAKGGYIDGQYFPRRNGGIMPSEGSGQKDDVPAMLMAGEFVLTKDAVKGLGNGDSNRGIEKAYSMMNKLEDRADNYG